tara:strand:- start:217 stop:627 length:411 start_codon:yes stop_codon:yes gene_type:complete
MNARQFAQQRVNQKLLGYKIRTKLFDEEDKFFQENPKVAGMASFETNDIILNPYSPSSINKTAVAMNEALRLKMNSEKFVPDIEITDEQRDSFEGTSYEGNDNAIKQTIFARIYSGDSSANATKKQIDSYKNYMNK